MERLARAGIEARIAAVGLGAHDLAVDAAVLAAITKAGQPVAERAIAEADMARIIRLIDALDAALLSPVDRQSLSERSVSNGVAQLLPPRGHLGSRSYDLAETVWNKLAVPV